MSAERASENIKAFVARYGEKGFLRLFFSNYLYEITLSYVRAHSDTASKDSGYAFHFAKEGTPRPVKEDEEVRRTLRKECDQKAAQIVATLEVRNLLPKFDENLDAITAQNRDEVDAALKEIFEKVLNAKWGTET
jgi:hypothetical protein